MVVVDDLYDNPVGDVSLSPSNYAELGEVHGNIAKDNHCRRGDPGCQRPDLVHFHSALSGRSKPDNPRRHHGQPQF